MTRISFILVLLFISCSNLGLAAIDGDIESTRKQGNAHRVQTLRNSSRRRRDARRNGRKLSTFEQESPHDGSCDSKWPDLNLFLPIELRTSPRDTRYYEYETMFLRSAMLFWPWKQSNSSLIVVADEEYAVGAYEGYWKGIQETFNSVNKEEKTIPVVYQLNAPNKRACRFECVQYMTGWTLEGCISIPCLLHSILRGSYESLV